MSLTEGHWQVSTGPPTKGTWQLTTRPPTKGTWQLSTGPPTEGHWQVLGLWLRPGLGARLWLELRYGLRPLSLTSGSQDVDGLVAFLVFLPLHNYVSLCVALSHKIPIKYIYICG